MMGNVMQKQVFNGSAGYTEAQGQKYQWVKMN